MSWFFAFIFTDVKVTPSKWNSFVVPAGLRTGWRWVLTVYWWILSLRLPDDVKKSYTRIREVLDTPAKVMAWLWANVTYTADKTMADEWQPAWRTFERRAGDCEDWAIFANYCLRDRVNGFYVCMYTETSGHAELLICDLARGFKQSEGGAFIPVEGEWTSVGTFGLNSHDGKLPAIVSDWAGFEDWTMVVLMDGDMEVLEAWYR